MTTDTSKKTLLDMGMTNTIEERKRETPPHPTIFLTVVFDATYPAIREVIAPTKGSVPAKIPPIIVLCLRFFTISSVRKGRVRLKKRFIVSISKESTPNIAGFLNLCKCISGAVGLSDSSTIMSSMSESGNYETE